MAKTKAVSRTARSSKSSCDRLKNFTESKCTQNFRYLSVPRRNEIWIKLYWKNPNQKQAMHSVICAVTSNINEVQKPIVSLDNWPRTMIMQFAKFKNFKVEDFLQILPSPTNVDVFFHLPDGPPKDALTKILTEDHFGFMQLPSENKKLFLLCAPGQKNYMGFVESSSIYSHLLTRRLERVH